jgi:hypothetical protein
MAIIIKSERYPIHRIIQIISILLNFWSIQKTKFVFFSFKIICNALQVMFINNFEGELIRLKAIILSIAFLSHVNFFAE